MKRIFSLFIAFIMFIVLLSGCKLSESETVITDSQTIDGNTDSGSTSGSASQSTAKPGQTTEITMAHWSASGQTEKVVIDQVLNGFQKKYPSIKVKLNIMGDGYEVKMTSMLAAKSEPDVILVPDGQFGTWVKTGALLNINSRVTTSKDLDISKMWSTAIARYRWDGKMMGSGDIYALPKDIGPVVMYYNKDIFKKYGVATPPNDRPMTTTEALEMWKKLTHDDNGDGRPEVYGMGRIWWEGMVMSNGGKILSDDRKSLALNDPKSVAAIQFVADCINVHKIAPDGKTQSTMQEDTMFSTGKIACIENGRWAVTSYRQFGFDWDVCPMPSFTEKPLQNSWSGSVGYAVSARSKKADEAYKLVEYFASPDGQELMSAMGFSIPLYSDIAKTDKFLQPTKKPANAKAFITAAENQQAGLWQLVPNKSWIDTLNQEMSPVWEGKKTAEQAIGDMKPKIDGILKAS